MKKTTYIFLLCLLTIGFSIQAQTKFQTGYYITNSGEKISGQILKENWRENPTDFKFKTSDTSKASTLSIKTVEEFGIDNAFKFIRRNVQIDYSSEKTTSLSYRKEPEYKRGVVFLKVLSEGLVNLYYYNGKGVNSFYFSKVDKVIMNSIHDTSVVGGEIIPLVYKRYLDSNNQIRENNAYKQLLYKYITDCSSISDTDFRGLTYNAKSMSAFILKYNSCSGDDSKSFETARKRLKVNLNLRVGTLNSSPKLETPTRAFNFDSYSSIKYGIEGELFLPFGNDNWSVYAGYERKEKVSITTPIIYKNPGATPTDTQTTLVYNSSELLVGFRHYINLNNDFKISLGGGFAFDTRSKLALEFDAATDIVTNRFGTNLILTAGLHYKRFGLHGLMHIGKDYLADTGALNSDVSEYNLMLSYSIISTKK